MLQEIFDLPNSLDCHRNYEVSIVKFALRITFDIFETTATKWDCFKRVSKNIPNRNILSFERASLIVAVI